MHNALRVHDGINAVAGQVKEPVRFDDFQTLVHQAGAVDGDLAAHLPSGVTQRFGQGGVGGALGAPCAKRTTACGEHQPIHFAQGA